MKTLFAILCLVSTLSAFAAKDPNFCKNAQDKDVCNVKPNDLFGFLNKGTFYARAYGRTCEEAKEEANEINNRVLQQANIEGCGAYAYAGADCYTDSRGAIVAWSSCEAGKGSMQSGSSRSQRCANVGGGLVCH